MADREPSFYIRSLAVPAFSLGSTMTSTPERRAPDWSRLLGGLLLGLALLTLWTGPLFIRNDGLLRYEQLDRLLSSGALTPDKYSLVGPMTATPLYELGAWVHSQPAPWVARINLVHLTLAIAILLLRNSLGSMTVRLRFAVLLCMASMFPRHVQEFYGEVFTAVWAAIGLLLLLEGRWVTGSILAALAVANTPAALVGLVTVAIDRIMVEKRLRWLLPIVLAALVIMAENTLRRGSPLEAGYGVDQGFVSLSPYSGLPGFSYPILLGLLGLTVSFGKGLAFFAPGLFCALHPDHRSSPIPVLRVWMIFSLGLLLVYSCWWSWYGGWFWGPRFLLFASIPAALALARLTLAYATLSTGWLIVTVLVTTTSFWVGASGFFYDQRGLEYLTMGNYALESLAWYAPEFSVLWHPLMPPTNIDALRGHPVFAPFAGPWVHTTSLVEYWWHPVAFVIAAGSVVLPMVWALGRRASRLRKLRFGKLSW